MGDPPILIVLVVFFCFWISSYPDGFGFFGFVFFVFCLFLVLPSIAQKTENCDVGAALVHQPSFARQAGVGETPLHKDLETQASLWQACDRESRHTNHRPLLGPPAHLPQVRPRKVGSIALARKIRAAQWTYWHRSQNLWVATGRMLEDLRA